MSRFALAVLLATASLPAQSLLCDQPNISLRPGETTCVTVRTLPSSSGVTILSSTSGGFLNVSPTSAVTGANGDATFTVTAAGAVNLMGASAFFNDTAGTFAFTQTDVICDEDKLTLQGTAGSAPGLFDIEIEATPPVWPGDFGGIFLSPTFGVLPLVIFNNFDPRVLGVGPTGLMLPFAGPFAPPFDKFSAPPLALPALPGPATIYVQGTTINFAGPLFQRVSQAAPVYLSAPDACTTRFQQMSMVRSFFPLIERADQKMMAIGGGAGGIFAQVATDQCDVYDPFTDTWSTNANPMTTARSLHTATRLTNGRYLIVGGVDDNNDPQITAEIYDPASNTFRRVGNLGTARVGHSATLLANGQVLVAGGLSAIGGATLGGITTTLNSTLASTELFTLDATGCGGSFTTGPNMTKPRAGHAVVQLSDGRHYFMGGVGWSTFIVKLPAIWSETEFFNGTNFSGGPSMGTARALFSVTRIGSSPETLLVAGGLNSILGAGAPTNLADRYVASPNQNGNWSPAGAMSAARGMQDAYVFGDRVYQFGGIKGDLIAPEALGDTEVYTISTGAWSKGPNLTTPRGAYASYRDNYGVIHIMGGAAGAGPTPQVSSTTEWYHQ